VSTLLTLAVVAVAILGVLRIALSEPDQPATVRRRNRSRDPHPAPGAAMSAQPAPVRSVAVRERAVAAAPRRAGTGGGTSVWTRVRSGIALVVLVAVVGAMLALAVGAVLVGGALALRSAVS
jgi:ABC-type dipeptide/oligopeptide/nickel transport system permease subunit